MPAQPFAISLPRLMPKFTSKPAARPVRVMAQEPLLKSKKVWAGAYGLVVAFAFMAQLALGANLGIIILLAALSALAVLPLSGSMVTVGDGVFFVFLLYSAPLALILKTLVGQAVNTNLNDPDQSAVYLTIGTASATFGYLVVRRRSRMFNATQSLAVRYRKFDFLSRVSMPVFLVGALAVALQAILLRRSDNAGLIASSAASFGLFGVLVLPGLIMAFSTTLLDKLGGRLHNNPLAIFLLTATATLERISSALNREGFTRRQFSDS